MIDGEPHTDHRRLMEAEFGPGQSLNDLRGRPIAFGQVHRNQAGALWIKTFGAEYLTVNEGLELQDRSVEEEGGRRVCAWLAERGIA